MSFNEFESEAAEPGKRRYGAIWGTFSIAYFVFLISLSIWLKGWGERWWPTYFFLYLPATIWLLPLVPLGVGALFFQRRALIPVALSIIFWMFCIAGLRLGGGGTVDTSAKRVKIVTNNVGECNNTDVTPFWKAENADFLILQDVLKEIYYERRAYPGFYTMRSGSHFLVSRFPILSVNPISTPPWRGSPGVMFTVDWEGQAIHIYSIHTPTVRPEFTALFLGDRKQNALDKRLARFSQSMNERMVAMEKLAQIIANDPAPVIAAGDFNMPYWGHSVTLFTANLRDAHAETGVGFGYTFPGSDPYIPTWLGPWLRIDYAFCNQAWRPVASHVEKVRPTQHRALSATFELIKK